MRSGITVLVDSFFFYLESIGMNKLITVIMIGAAALISACGQSESPEVTSNLTVRYATIDMADIGTAAALRARCEE
jgi:hypothetical protein